MRRKREANFSILEVGIGAVNSTKRLRTADKKPITDVDDKYLYVSVTGLHGDQKDDDKESPTYGENKGNDNGDFFEWENELLKVKTSGPFRGKLTFQTWDGKPVHLNHKEDYSWGYIVATFPIAESKSIYMLLAVDKEKEPELCQAIQDGNVNAVSMGCTIEYSICGRCEKVSYNDDEWCECLKKYKGRRHPEDNKWVYEINKDIEGNEISFIVKKIGNEWENDIQADKGAEAKTVVAKKMEVDMAKDMFEGSQCVKKDGTVIANSYEKLRASASTSAEEAFKVEMGSPTGGGGGGNTIGAGDPRLARELRNLIAEETGHKNVGGNSPIQLPASYTTPLEAHAAIEAGKLNGADIIRVACDLQLVKDVEDCNIKQAKEVIASSAKESFGKPQAKKVAFKKVEAKKSIKCASCGKMAPETARFCPLCGKKITAIKKEKAVKVEQKVVEKGPEEKGDKVPTVKTEAPETVLTVSKETENDPKRKDSDFKEVPTQKIAQLDEEVKEEIEEGAEAVGEAVEEGAECLSCDGDLSEELETPSEELEEHDGVEGVADDIQEDVQEVKDKVEDIKDAIGDLEDSLADIGSDFAAIVGEVPADKLEETGKNLVDNDVFSDEVEDEDGAYAVLDSFYDNVDVPGEDEDVKACILTAKKKVARYAKMKISLKKKAQLMGGAQKQINIGDTVAVKTPEDPNKMEKATVTNVDPAKKTVQVQTPTGVKESQEENVSQLKVASQEKDEEMFNTNEDKTEKEMEEAQNSLEETKKIYAAEWVDSIDDETGKLHKEESGYLVFENGEPQFSVSVRQAFGDVDNDNKRIASATMISHYKEFRSADYKEKLLEALNVLGTEGTLTKHFKHATRKEDFEPKTRVAQTYDSMKSATTGVGMPQDTQVENVPPTEPEEDVIVDQEVSDEVLNSEPEGQSDILDTISDVIAPMVAAGTLTAEDFIEQVRTLGTDEVALSEFRGKLDEKVKAKQDEMQQSEETVVNENVVSEEPVGVETPINQETENAGEITNKMARLKVAKSIYDIEKKVEKLQERYATEKKKNIELKKIIAERDRKISAYEAEKVELVKKPKVKKISSMMKSIGLEPDEKQLMAMDDKALVAKQQEVSKIYAKFEEQNKRSAAASDVDTTGLIGGTLPKAEPERKINSAKVPFKFSSVRSQGQ
jgi:Zn finger protein HypA/HybF involved in hydrogenase expression